MYVQRQEKLLQNIVSAGLVASFMTAVAVMYGGYDQEEIFCVDLNSSHSDSGRGFNAIYDDMKANRHKDVSWGHIQDDFQEQAQKIIRDVQARAQEQGRLTRRDKEWMPSISVNGREIVAAHNILLAGHWLLPQSKTCLRINEDDHDDLFTSNEAIQQETAQEIVDALQQDLRRYATEFTQFKYHQALQNLR